MADTDDTHTERDPFAAWFLDGAERGNPTTDVDRDNGRQAWTDGNRVPVLIDVAAYFPQVPAELRCSESGDWIYLADLPSDGDEQLDGPGSEIGGVLAEVARRGVNVRGLLWRSHPAGHGAAEVTNMLLSRTVNEAGGEVVLDHRVRRAGSHHQKLVVLHRGSLDTADHDVAFLGGIDLAHGRHDGAQHHGDPQPLHLSDARYGERPPWHDVQVRVDGPAVRQISWTFRERWLDPNPLDRPTPVRALRHALTRKPPERGKLADPDRSPSSRG